MYFKESESQLADGRSMKLVLQVCHSQICIHGSISSGKHCISVTFVYYLKRLVEQKTRIKQCFMREKQY